MFPQFQKKSLPFDKAQLRAKMALLCSEYYWWINCAAVHKHLWFSGDGIGWKSPTGMLPWTTWGLVFNDEDNVNIGKHSPGTALEASIQSTRSDMEATSTSSLWTSFPWFAPSVFYDSQLFVWTGCPLWNKTSQELQMLSSVHSQKWLGGLGQTGSCARTTLVGGWKRATIPTSSPGGCRPATEVFWKIQIIIFKKYDS